MSVYLQKKPTTLVIVPWHASTRNASSLVPVFTPYAGCAIRCVFCAQHIQTGNEQPMSISDVIDRASDTLHRQHAQSKYSVEVAFFGGTFTALPEQEFTHCIAAVAQWRKEGLITRARCSTRPDADPERLLRLVEAGFNTVELGIQSFNTKALSLSERGYSGDAALQACAAVRAAGLALGVQLLPGMPGVTPETFVSDVSLALEAGAQMLRFYPCQVLRGTELARRWQAGTYTPWELTQTVDTLAKGWLLAQDRRVPVIRMGLAPEPGLEGHILAGPRHPALGSLVQAEALYRTVERALATQGAGHAPAESTNVRSLHMPRCCQGYFWGHKNSLRPRWQALGITSHNCHFHEAEEIHLTLADPHITL